MNLAQQSNDYLTRCGPLDGLTNQSRGSESRIKFKIPMSYPMHEYAVENSRPERE